jgi:hypothetical protein
MSVKARLVDLVGLVNERVTVVINDADTSSLWEDPIANVNQAPYDREDDDLGDENANDKYPGLCIWGCGVKELVHCSSQVSVTEQVDTCEWCWDRDRCLPQMLPTAWTI